MGEELVSAVDDVPCHRGTHDPQADESNCAHSHLPFCCGFGNAVIFAYAVLSGLDGSNQASPSAVVVLGMYSQPIQP
jgi:hypothetical protein